MSAPVTRLAVHEQVVGMVLSPASLVELEAVARFGRVSPDLWSSGWPADADVEILITGWGTPPIDDEALDRMPRLVGIFHTAGSVRDVIAADVWTRGISVVTAADANNDMVAEFVAAHVILALKGTHRAARFMREQQRLPGFGAGPGTRGATVGLASFGSIARKVREKLRSIDADVLAWDPYVSDTDLAAAGVRRAESLGDLFAGSAVVSIHTPLIDGVTSGLIGKDSLTRLRQGATLINTSRGGIIDQDALTDVLRDRADLFAVLDVTTPEPPPADSPLYDLGNVLLTGHTAGSVGSECLRLGQLVVAEITRFAGGEPLRHSITRADAATRA